MGKRTTAKNRTRKNKSRRRYRHNHNKGGGMIANLLKSNGVVMPDEVTQRLFDNAIKVVERHPKYMFKIAKIFIIVYKRCMDIMDDMEKFKCGYKIASKIVTEKNEKEIKSILVEFVKQNKSDIQDLLREHNINGLEPILNNPQIIYQLDRSYIEDILDD